MTKIEIEIKDDSSYYATICRLTEVRVHPNAHSMLLADALGFQVIVGLDAKEGDMVVMFPSDGRLSREMLLANNLYRKDPDTGIEMGGYFEENGRVKAIRLRKASSEAFVTSVNSLDWAIAPIDLEEGDTFTHLNGKLVCEKYYTPATIKAMKNRELNGKKKKKPQDYAPEFTRHFSTTKLRHDIYSLVGTSLEMVVTEKLHGTSGRTGLVKWTDKKWYQRLLSWVNLYEDKYRYISGTRKVVYSPDAIQGEETGFYEGSTFRKKIHNFIKSRGVMKEGEILYYEIVGYTDTGSAIMGSHSLKDLKDSGVPKKEYAKYGNTVTYSYGTKLDRAWPFEVYVYRIVQDGVDLPWEEVEIRANQIGLFTVPELGTIKLNGSETASEIMHLAEAFTLGDSVLDERHFKEGVCLRIDSESDLKVYKYKGELFCILEGIRKNSDSYVDLEEIS